MHPGDAEPAAERLLAHCDAVLCLPGASTGADQDVAIDLDLGATPQPTATS